MNHVYTETLTTGWMIPLVTNFIVHQQDSPWTVR